MQMVLRENGEESHLAFPQVDHFAGQIAYFSDCVEQGNSPEADGAEGLADIRTLLAIDDAVLSGATVALAPRPFPQRNQGGHAATSSANESTSACLPSSDST